MPLPIIDPNKLLNRKPVLPAQEKQPIIPTRDDLNKQADRESAEAINTNKVLGDAFSAAAAKPMEMDTAAPAPAFAAFQNILQQQSPEAMKLQQATQAKVMEGLTKPAEGIGAAGDKATADLQRYLQSLRAEQGGELIKKFGAGTGQVHTGLERFDLMGAQESGDLAADLAIADEAAKREQGAQALKDALTLTGQQTEARTETAGQLLSAIQTDIDNLTQRELQTGAFAHEEKLELIGQSFAENENEKDRVLSRYGTDERIKADITLNDSRQAFEKMMSDKGYLEEKDLIQLKGEVEAGLLAMGFDADTAARLADYAHEDNILKQEQAYSAEQNELDRLWRSGERIDTQVWEEVIVKMKQKYEAGENKLDRILELDVQENRLAYETSSQAAAEYFEYLMQEGRFTHEEVMNKSRETFEKEMAAFGFSKEQILQASRITAEQTINKANIDSREGMLTAELAQRDDQFRDELGLDRDKLAVAKDEIKNDFIVSMSALGIENEKFKLDEKATNAMLETAEVSNAIELMAIATELFPNDEQALRPFAEKLFATIGAEMDMSPDEIDAAVKKSLDTTAGVQTAEDVETYDDLMSLVDNFSGMDFGSPEQNAIQIKANVEPALLAMNSGEIQALLDDSVSLGKLRDAGVIASKEMDMSQSGLKRPAGWKAQGFNPGDIVVMEVDGKMHLIKLATEEEMKSFPSDPVQTPTADAFLPYRSVKNMPLTGHDTRTATIFGTDLTEGDTKVNEVFKDTWKL